jgi:putative ABC transport system substrate-binding protein
MWYSTVGCLVTLTLSLLAAPLAAEAQRAGKVPRLGVLVPAEPPSYEEPNLAAFRQRLRDLGYVEGQTMAVEYRYAHGVAERYRELIAELVRLPVDVLVVGSGPAALVAKSVTQTIPIVAVGAGDPVGSGLVASLARPGGNITGLSLAFGEGFSGKWVELLKEVYPQVARVGYLYNPASMMSRTAHDLQIATQALGVTLQPLEVSELAQVDRTLAIMSQEGGGALIIMGDPLFFPHRSRLPELVAAHRLPAIYTFRVFVEAGGLMSYGVSLPDIWRRAATYVDKILKGAKPADLPVEQAMKFELVINLKTAQALGLTIPPTILFQADEVIK